MVLLEFFIDMEHSFIWC